MKRCNFQLKEHSNRLIKNRELPIVTTVYLRIQGMKTPDCAIRIYNALMVIKGVIQVGIVMENGLAAAVFMGDEVSPDALVKAIEEIICKGRHLYTAEITIVSSNKNTPFS